MKKINSEIWNDLCTFTGSSFGFIGAVFLAIAFGQMPDGYQIICEPITAEECQVPFVGVIHPLLNEVGIILICAGFFIQLSPFLITIAKRGFAALERFH